MGYTKGEWEVFDAYKKTHGIIIRTKECGEVARCFGDDAEANAHLIAQSPRMAKLLLRLVNDGWSASISMEAKEIIQTLDLS